MLLRLATAVDTVTERLGRAVSWLVVVMVLVGSFNALARYGGRWVGTNLASNTWLELQWYLFAVLVLFGAPDALRRDAHVRVDVLYGRLGAVGRRRIDVAGTCLFLLPFAVFGVISSLPMVQASVDVWEGSPDPGGLPRWPLKALLPIAFLLLGLQGLAQLVPRPTPSPGEDATP